MESSSCITFILSFMEIGQLSKLSNEGHEFVNVMTTFSFYDERIPQIILCTIHRVKAALHIKRKMTSIGYRFILQDSRYSQL